MIFILAVLVALMAINALYLDHRLNVLRRDLDDELNDIITEIYALDDATAANFMDAVVDFEKRVDQLETFG